MATARTITRFGRTYAEYDPDGTGGGPSTWVLSSAGAGPAGAPGSGQTTGSFTPAVPATTAKAGMAVFFNGTGTIDLALAKDATAPATAHPYEVAGLLAADATNGQIVAVITDGQVSQADWLAVTGAAVLEVNKRYFLSDATPGMLTTTCPAAVGSTVVCVGQAISQQTLDVEVNLLVKL